MKPKADRPQRKPRPENQQEKTPSFTSTSPKAPANRHEWKPKPSVAKTKEDQIEEPVLFGDEDAEVPNSKGQQLKAKPETGSKNTVGMPKSTVSAKTETKQVKMFDFSAKTTEKAEEMQEYQEKQQTVNLEAVQHQEKGFLKQGMFLAIAPGKVEEKERNVNPLEEFSK